jgi:hypothetical protein
MANNDIMITVGLAYQSVVKGLRQITNLLKGSGSKDTYFTKSMDLAQAHTKRAEKAVKDANLFIRKETMKTSGWLSAQLKKNDIRFQGWAMSVMFFGMAINRVLSSIWKESAKTYGDAMHSIQGTVTGFDTLNSSLAYMQFTIGQALEPIAEWLAVWVDKLSTLISDHPVLAKWLFIIAGVIGGILFLLGTWVLASTGIVTMFRNIGSIVGWLGTMMKGTTISTISLSTAMKALVASSIIGGIILVGLWIYELQKKMGGLVEFFWSFVRGMLRVFTILGAAILGIFSEVFNFIKKGWNGVIWLLNKIPGVDLSSWKADTKGMGESFKDSYGSLMGGYVGWEEKYLAPKNGYMDFGGITPQSSGTVINNYHYGDVVVPEGTVDLSGVQKGFNEAVAGFGSWNPSLN